MRTKNVLILITIFLGSMSFSNSEMGENNHNAFLSEPEKINETIAIDGNLTEAIWSGEGIKGDFISFNPLHGDTLPIQTTLWMATNEENLHFAFKCDEPEPELINTSISRRDNIDNDDTIGVVNFFMP